MGERFSFVVKILYCVRGVDTFVFFLHHCVMLYEVVVPLEGECPHFFVASWCNVMPHFGVFNSGIFC